MLPLRPEDALQLAGAKLGGEAYDVVTEHDELYLTTAEGCEVGIAVAC